MNWTEPGLASGNKSNLVKIWDNERNFAFIFRILTSIYEEMNKF